MTITWGEMPFYLLVLPIKMKYTGRLFLYFSPSKLPRERVFCLANRARVFLALTDCAHMKQSRQPDECVRRQRLRHDGSWSHPSEIRVPNDDTFYGFLCGDHKKTLRSLIQETGADISLHKGADAFVRIEGTQAQREHAAGRLAEKLAEFKALERCGKVEVFVPLNQKFWDFFVGPGGVNIAKLREQGRNRVRITLDKEHNPPLVRVIACVADVTPAEIEGTVKLVRVRLAEYERLCGHASLAVPLGPKFQAFLYGDRAANVDALSDALEDELGVHISLRPPVHGAQTRELRVTGGEASQRERALECLRAKLAEFLARSAAVRLFSTSPDQPPSSESATSRQPIRRHGVLRSWKPSSTEPLVTDPAASINFSRNFGFIARRDGTEIFVHARDLQSAEGMAIGARVEYTEAFDPTKDKPQAENVVVLTSQATGKSERAGPTGMSERAGPPSGVSASLPAVAQKEEALPSSVRRAPNESGAPPEPADPASPAKVNASLCSSEHAPEACTDCRAPDLVLGGTGAEAEQQHRHEHDVKAEAALPSEKLLEVEQEPSASSSELPQAVVAASEEASVLARETTLEGGDSELLMVRLLALREHLERCKRIAELLARNPKSPRPLGVHWNLQISRRALVPDVLAQFGQLTTGVAGGTGPIQLWRNTYVTFVDAFGMDEPGIDQGGLTVELHATFWSEVFKQGILFEQGDDGRHLPRAGAPTDDLEATGRMLLKSIIDDHPTGGFSRFVFEFLADSHERRVFLPSQPLEALRALEDFNPELAKQWRRCVLEMGDEELSHLTLEQFEPSLGDGVVTRANVAEVVVAGCRRKLLLERQEELEALRRGFTFDSRGSHLPRGMDLEMQLARS